MITFPHSSNILVLGAHPDDMEIGMGGTIEKLTRWNSVFCCHTTNGVYTDMYGKLVRNFDEIEKSTTKSLSRIGVKPINILFNAGVNATELKVNKDLVSFLQRIISEQQIQYIFTQGPYGTFHQDHRATYLGTLAAARRYVQNIYYYETVFDMGRGIMIPNLYVPIDINRKLLCLEDHKTEYNKFGEQEWLEKVKNLARYRGDQIGVEYAEAFYIVKEAWTDI